ncbi:MAG: 4Fe-4S dicluster domain-containing protein [Desulforudis sp.]|nr:MAG: 4Fe-4S dicluster domain-containing protein [Desulforudis sp.]
MSGKMMLVDVTKCTACRGCQSACKNWNMLPGNETSFTGNYENPPDLGPSTWTRVAFNEVVEGTTVRWSFAKIQCMHCDDPVCAAVCPYMAISKNAQTGAVTVNRDVCIGCGFCQVFCPYEIPRVNNQNKKVYKCTMCHDRVASGLLPACVQTCPVQALQFGAEDQLFTAAKQRVNFLRRNGYPRAQLYGLWDGKPVGRVIYVLADDPDRYKLLDDPAPKLGSYFVEATLKPLQALAVAGLAAGVFFRAQEDRTPSGDE